MERNNQPSKLLFLTVYLSLAAIAIGELFEQVVFVPNWLIGNIDENIASFRAFKHLIDPGVFYFPLSLIFIISSIVLFRNKQLTEQQKSALKVTLIAFAVVFVTTIYVIVTINVPAIDKGLFSGEVLASKMKLWAILNCFRIILPFYGLFLLSRDYIAISK